MLGSAKPFAYAILRLVPRIDRGERVNVAAVLFCRQCDGFLGIRTAVDYSRARTLDPHVQVDELQAQLRTLELIAAGNPAGGPVAALEPSERFGWLVAPSSTIIQPSEVHTGLCTDPEAELEALFAKLVSAP